MNQNTSDSSARIKSILSGTRNPLLIPFSCLLLILTYLLPYFEFERDLDVYLEYIYQCSPFITSLDFQVVLRFLSIVFCASSSLFVVIQALLNFFTLFSVLSSLAITSSVFLSAALIANPLALTWISFPSKESFIVVSSILILYPYRNLHIKVILTILAAFLIILIRPFLVAYVILILLQSFIYRDLANLRFRSLFLAKPVLIMLPFLFILGFLAGSSFPILYDSAQLASLSLDNDGFKNLIVYQSSNPVISAVFNTPLLFVFAFFSQSSNKILLIATNLVILYFCFRVFKLSKTLNFVFLQMLYVLPYSLTVVNSGTALRVVLTSTILSCISFKASLEAKNSTRLHQ
jgi:hypothetical protein